MLESQAAIAIMPAGGTPKRPHPLLVYAAALLATALIAAQLVWAKVATPYTHPFPFAALRTTIAVPFLTPLAVRENGFR